MQQRQFAFGQHLITVSCREPPEAQAGKTLTWQLDGSAGSSQSGKRAEQVANPTAEQDGRGDRSAADAPASGRPPIPAATDAPDLIGLDIWPASIALCHYLAANSQLVAGQAVIELGAGMGLVGLLCAALGASHVLLTDYEPQVLEQLGINTALSGTQHLCSVQRLDWRQPISTLRPEQRGCWRLVVAADVMYASAVVQPLIDTLQLLLHEEGVALVGHQVRRAVVLDPATRLPRLDDADEPLQRFQAGCAAAGLQVRVLGRRQTCSNLDSDPMVLLAVGRGGGTAQHRMEQLPLPPE